MPQRTSKNLFFSSYFLTLQSDISYLGLKCMLADIISHTVNSVFNAWTEGKYGIITVSNRRRSDFLKIGVLSYSWIKKSLSHLRLRLQGCHKSKFLTMSTEFDKNLFKMKLFTPLITKITLKTFLNIFCRSY